MNFISRLHRDRVDIVPWPLMGSKQFYTLFKAIKKSLDEQAVTHHGGAVFLQTMKTLMAKLKVGIYHLTCVSIMRLIHCVGQRLGSNVAYVARQHLRTIVH